MKLLIAVDMEGITGVVSWDHVDPHQAEYQRFRRLMTDDVNAAIAGAAEAGADDIQVSDGHWNSGNILIEELDSRARLNTGTPAPFSMVQGVQHGVDAVFFIGYHARIGTPNAILDHTWSASRVANLWLNDRLVGETGLNASVCGAFGAPVLLVSGDQSVAAEAQEWIPGVETAIVKQACGRFAAQCLPPAESHPLIRNAAQRAIERWKNGQAPAPLDAGSPVNLRVQFHNTQMADMAVLMPGATRLDGRTIEFQSSNAATAYCAFRTAVSLANL